MPPNRQDAFETLVADPQTAEGGCTQFSHAGCERFGREPEVPEGFLGWGENLCHTAFFAPTNRGYTFDPDRFDRGHFAFRTIHPVRAAPLRGTRPPQVGDEPCRYHLAKVRVGKDGLARGVYCSNPDDDDRAMTKTHIARPFVQKVTDPHGLIDKGYAVFVGSYHAPMTTENLLHSHRAYCGDIPT